MKTLIVAFVVLAVTSSALACSPGHGDCPRSCPKGKFATELQKHGQTFCRCVDPCKEKKCASDESCKLTKVQCFRSPCPPIATCDPHSPSCKGGQVWSECGSACTPTCDTQDLACIAVCTDARCQCPSDRPLLENGICITAKQCVNVDPCSTVKCASGFVCEVTEIRCITTPCPSPIATCVPRCTGGQVWSECGSACTPTCDTQDLACIQVCTDARCQCPSDRPLLDNGICISAKQCPTEDPCKEMECASDEVCELRKVQCESAPCPPIATCVPRCTGGQVWSECGSACTPTCDTQDLACIEVCTPARCQCPSDRPLLDNGICISAKQCPTEDPCKEMECAADETCQLRKVVCVQAPCPPIATCVPRCKGGQVWEEECGRSCTPTCDTRNDPCLAVCAPARCQCPSDRVILDNGRCISADQCGADNPCMLVLCAPGLVCEVTQIKCITTPCPSPIANCVLVKQ